MWRFSYSFCLMFIAGALLVGCSDQPTSVAPEGDEAGMPIVASKKGPPASSGAYVIRYEDTIIGGLIDRNGLRLNFGADLVSLCQTFDPSFISILSVKDILSPSEVDRILRMLKGRDIYTELWDFSEFGPPDVFNCDYVNSHSPLARGTGHIIVTDNDVFAGQNPDSRNANAWGVSVHGKLHTPQGERLVANAHLRCVWDGLTGERVSNCSFNLVVR